jgi:hypothetical protein
VKQILLLVSYNWNVWYHKEVFALEQLSAVTQLNFNTTIIEFSCHWWFVQCEHSLRNWLIPNHWQSMTCSEVLVKFQGKGHENSGNWVYILYFIFHDAQPQVTTRHTRTTKVMQLKLQNIVFQSVCQASMVNMNALLLFLIFSVTYSTVAVNSTLRKHQETVSVC